MKTKILIACIAGLGLYLAHSQAVQVWQGGKSVHYMIPTEIDSFQVSNNKLYLWKQLLKKDSINLILTDSVKLGPIYGTITDARDSKVYKTVQIGKQNWFAQNLNYGTRVSLANQAFYDATTEKYCPQNSEDSCTKYGALYNWSEAMSLSTSCNNAVCSSQIKPQHQGICPTGWHIPSRADWQSLITTVGPNAGTRMKSLFNNSSWNQGTYNDSNSTGFTAMPTGYIWSNAQQYYGTQALFWAAADSSVAGLGFGYYLDYSSSSLAFNAGDWKITGESVRCVQDTAISSSSSVSSSSLSSSSLLSSSVISSSSALSSSGGLSYGALTDVRDNKVYKTIIIGNQEWMAENLAYKPTSGSFWWYNNDSTLNSKYGRLYSWDVAMANSPSSATNPRSVQGICPTDWHLPSDTEWTILSNTLGGTSVAGSALKSTTWNGTNSSGFSALAGGYNAGGSFYNAGVNAYFWSATEYSQSNGLDRNLNSTSTFGRDYNSKTYGFSIRCVHGAALSSSAVLSSSSLSSSSVLSSSAISSSSLISSSSAQISSSSIAISYGTLVDTRDSKTYKTVVIGTQTWMAENLNYSPNNALTLCYNDLPSNCDTLGRLYDWNTALSSCPSGWHLPDTSEYSKLAMFISPGRKFYAGKDLKANSTLWSTNNGTDLFGFGALPSGNCDTATQGYHRFNWKASSARLWTKSSDSYGSLYFELVYNTDTYGIYSEWATVFQAIRCLKD